jgi:hypothetical protein
MKKSERFQKTMCKIKMTVFWDIALCSLVGVYRRFGRACCFHHQGDDGGTQRNTLESHPHTRRHENLKPYFV